MEVRRHPDQFESNCICEKDDSCLRLAECRLLSGCLLLSDCVGVCTSVQMRAMHHSRMGHLRWHLFIPFPPTHSEQLTTCQHPSESYHLGAFLARIHPVFYAKRNLFCILGHSLPGKNFVSLAVIGSGLLESSFPC